MNAPSDWIASPPSTWADREREFHLAYLDDPTPFPRQPVTVTWKGASDNPPPSHPVVLAVWAAIEGIRQARHRHGTGVWAPPTFAVSSITVRPPDGSKAMAFTIDEASSPVERTGAIPGVLVGGFGNNAVACIEIDGDVLWPTGHPITFDLPPAERS